MTKVEILWSEWLALNDTASVLESQQQYNTMSQKAALAKGRDLRDTEPTCLGDCLIQLRRAELLEDWPAVSRAIDAIAKLASINPVPNPWKAVPAIAA